MSLRRTLAITLTVLASAALLAIAPVARAANPSSGNLGGPGDRVTWTGGPFVASNPSTGLANDTAAPCGTQPDPSCDHFRVNVAPQAGATTLVVTVTAERADDFDLYVYGPNGERVATSANEGTPEGGESAAVGLPAPGTYDVRVQAWQVSPGATYAGSATLQAGGERTFEETSIETCVEAAPDKVGLAGVTDDGRRVSVDVTVLLDADVTEVRAREVMAYAKKSYDPLDIDLNVTRYVPVTAPSDGSAIKDGVTVGMAEGAAMIEFSKNLFGGGRPPDSDVVYLLTNKDLYTADEAEPDGRDENLLGLADCIGGVRFEQHAFATGELGDELFARFGPVSEFGNAGSKIVSHEIGHLLGAHHHYFNCVEGVPTESEEGELSPCTIMAPFVNVESINFGVADGAVVRGHAFSYAKGNDAIAAAAREAAEREAAADPGRSAGSRGPGYALLGEDGGIFTFGAAAFFGSTGGQRLNQPVVGMAWSPTGKGYWVVARDGGIFTFGDAAFFGSTGDMRLNAPILGMESTPSGRGYWLVASDGGIFTFGDASFHGSTGDKRLNAPVVGLGTASTAKGYWLVARDGGIFTFGDAAFHGSTGDKKLNEPVFDLASTASDKGYWLVARDGGIFTFGDASFHGSSAAAGQPPVIGLDATATDKGYWIANRSGAVANFGDAPALGGLSGQRLNAPIVGFAAVPS